MVGASAVSLTVLGTLLLVAGVIVRGLAAGRAPWGNMFEFLLVLSLAAGGAYIALVRRRAVREAGVWIVALMLLALGLAVTSFYTPVDDLVPVLDSYWLVIHVAAAIVSGGGFTIGAITAALFLRHFTGDVPWAHLDVASVGDSPVDVHEWSAGPTGFGARALLSWLGSEDPLAGVGS